MWQLRLLIFVSALLNARCGMAEEQSVQFTNVGVIDHPEINESSGLAASHENPGCLWIHNDSGDRPRLFLVNANGAIRGLVTIDDADAHDWEDMCSFRLGGVSWLLIGDIGDNNKKRRRKSTPCCLYLVREPRVPRANGLPVIHCNSAAAIQFDYEDGPWNCEGLAVDTESRQILLLTKSLPQKCGLYVLPLDVKTTLQQMTAKRVASPTIPFATAMDVSPDGRTLVVATMLNGLAIRRQKDQPWAAAFLQPGTPFNLPPRQQGETICFAQDGQHLFLNSELTNQPLWSMPLPQFPSP